jgi:hypothetical protein
VVYSESLPGPFKLTVLSVEMKIGKPPGFSSDAKQVGVVISKHDVNVARKSSREFINNEWRAEISAANHFFAAIESGEDHIKIPEIVMNV